MKNAALIVLILFTLSLLSGTALANQDKQGQGAYWSGFVLQENSLAASLLYVPYVVLQGPVRIIDGIINPVPTSRSTSPPPAHRAP
jgi:hypothetical protein